MTDQQSKIQRYSVDYKFLSVCLTYLENLHLIGFTLGMCIVNGLLNLVRFGHTILSINDLNKIHSQQIVSDRYTDE